MSRLFSPIQIGSMVVKNRITMPALHLHYVHDGEVTPRLIDFYRERAAGGVGLISIGGCAISEIGGDPDLLGLSDDRFVPGLSELTRELHRVGDGVKLVAQLYHHGRGEFGLPDRLRSKPQPVSASAVTSRLSGVTPRELTRAEIKETIGDFGAAAARAVAAGFDGVEVSASAGYLICQFLSPVVNQRTDEYGGSPENRMRFGVEVVQEVRRRVGPAVPVLGRLAGNDFVPGGNTNADSALFARALEQAGADGFSVTGGWHDTRIPQLTAGVPRAAFAYLGRGVKNAVSVPVIVANRINHPNIAERVVAEGWADLVAMGRPLLADPELPNKARAGRADQILRCIACNQGCFDTIVVWEPAACVLNPRVGREAELAITPAEQPKRVLVVGGGPAGMQAARVAALRGHDVVLCEKEPELGGQILQAAAVPGKEEFGSLVQDLSSQLRELQVKVLVDTPATPAVVNALQPDAIVLATGVRSIIPAIPGVEKPHVVRAEDVLRGRAECGTNVVVIGGGGTGCEVALHLAKEGTLDAETAAFLLVNDAEDPETIKSLLSRGSHSVTVVKRSGRVAADVGRTTRWVLLQELQRHDVRILAGAPTLEILDDGVVVLLEGKETKLPADTVVLATGVEAESSLAESLGQAAELHVIGDAKEPRKMAEALYEGFVTGLRV